MLRMMPEDVLARLMDLKVRDRERYEVVVRIIRMAEARQVPRTPVTPCRPAVSDSQK